VTFQRGCGSQFPQQLRLTGLFSDEPEWVFKIQRTLLSSTDPRTLTSFIFHTGVTDWDIRWNLGAIFLFYDFLFETCFCDTYSDQLEMNFKKLRSFFLQNELIYKNHSHILHNCYGLIIIGGVLKPIFSPEKHEIS